MEYMFVETLKKKILYILGVLSILTSCEEVKVKNDAIQKIIETTPKILGGFSINGTIVSKKEAIVYLLNHKKDTIDSVTTKNKEFFFEGKVDTPNTNFLHFNNNSTFFVIENINFKALLDSLTGKVSGGTLNSNYQKFQSSNNSLAQQLLKFYDDYNRGDINLNNYLNKVDRLHKTKKKSLTKFILSNQYNLLSRNVLQENKFTSAEVLSLIQKINKQDNSNFYSHLTTLKDTLLIVEAKDKVLRRPSAPLFSGVNLFGRKSHLEELMKGKKAFLIDFWASWCPPCRQSSSKIIEIHNKYAPKGLGVLTVSEDRSVNEWRNGVFVDGLENWPNIYDEYNKISNLYGASALPHLVLIDKNGKIIKNKISINDLEIELEKIFN